MSSMNDNAKLYIQTLSYNENAAPAQVLAQPWWVRTPQPVYSPRHSCHIEPLICGENVFKRIAADLDNATDSVDIITWGFDPGMVLVRGVAGELGTRYGDLLKTIAARKHNPVQVRLLVWHDDVLAQSQMKNIPGFYGTRFPAVGCTGAGYYSKVHQEYNAAWFEEIRAGAIPNISFHVRLLDPALLKTSLQGESMPQGVVASVSSWYASHHQKMLLIDYEKPAQAIGYVMGHNSITDFWDTEAHLFRDPRRERFYREDPATEHNQAWKQGPALDPAGGLYVPATYHRRPSSSKNSKPHKPFWSRTVTSPNHSRMCHAVYAEQYCMT
ncbi:hypothetical protein [Janthinobacterium sp. HLX7-2]|uniref:hypothetical protein n=1 Tax=Janthinobacterium sp. HLX7-2 TaxID=1259331 RepID=UPI003F286064